MKPGIEGYDQTARVALALERMLRHAEAEYQRGSDQTQVYIDRCLALVWILRRDLPKLPVPTPGRQPVRLDGDATGGDAA